MEEWKEYKLKDVCIKITDGSHSSPKAQSEGYPMFSVKDMLENDFDYSNCKLISYEDFQILKRNDCVPQKDDILVAKDGSFLKQIFVCKEEREIGILSSIAIFRPDPQKVDSKFLCFLLKSPRVYNYIAKNCVSGTALPRIILKDFKEIDLRIPSLDLQRTIVAKLAPFNDIIECERKIIDNLENQAQSLFNAWLDGDVDNKTSHIVRLTDIAEYINGLAMQKYPPTEEDEGLPVLKIKELGQKNCDKNSDRCSSQIESRYIVNNGDIIFSWSGTLLVDLWCGNKCGLNQHLFKVVPKEGYPKWFVYFWTKHHLRNFIRIAQDKAVTMGHIKRGDLDASKVIIPSIEIMEKMSNIIRPLMNAIIVKRIEISRLSMLRDALLPKLIYGQFKL